MAAEPTRIKLKRSTTATVVPTTSNLTDGEVALNIADRKLYVNNAGTIVEVANQKPNTGEVTTSMLATDITNGPGNTYYVATTGSNVNTLGSGGANGKHSDTPFLTVAKALSVATSGDTVNIAAGTYQETFPLTVPDGVTLRGANLRSTQIIPTPSTNDLNAFILQGDCHVSDLTVKDFFYNSGNDTGYGFVCASSLDSDRSPYVERVSVLTKGSVTSASDPYGFAQGDAGRGAKLDGALFSSNSIEAAILFNEVTFIVPNSVGLLVTNGVRVEWLNSFVYFAAEGIKGVQGATGRAGAGQTRLKLAGVSGTFSAAEVIYQLEDNFQSGTYSRTATTVTITRNAHGLQNGDVVYADFTSGAGTDGFYTIANVTTNTFDLTDTASGTTSGNVTYKKADAYGTITTNDGTYLLINGKGVGEFTVGVPTGKVGVIAGDAQLDTAQKQFGTASLLLDGTTDHLSFPTDEDFGFGTTNWAAECFIRPASVTGTQYLLDFRDASASDTAPTLYLDGTTLNFGVGNTSQISGGTLATNTWYHVAVARFGGTTKLFLDGTELGTYSDTNDYGSTKPLGVGGEYAGTNEFAGHIDEIRVSKATARYTGAFTAPTAAFTTDLNTVLLLHFDGTDGSTTILDSGKGVRDIRSSGGDSATSLLTADYAQFGAELRSIASANVYGTKGAIADGAGVKLLLTGHNFAYIGSGADFTNDPDLAVPANEVTETNGGRIFYSATNEKGDFRIGDAFVVDQQTGNVQFQSTSTAQEAANITLTDATGTTRIFPAFVETGNLRLSGNTLSSTSGNVIVDPSANEDILLNAQTIIPEELYFDNSKIVSIDSQVTGGLSFSVDGDEQAGFGSYGLFTNKNISVFSLGLTTVSIDDEGSEYTPLNGNFDLVTTPPNAATGSVTLETSGSINSITYTNTGSSYITAPNVDIGAPNDPQGTQATATTNLKPGTGRLVEVRITNGGTGYTSPTLTLDPPTPYTIDTVSNVNAATDYLTISNNPFQVNDRVVYSTNSGSQNIGLVDATTYYIVAVDGDTVQLSTSQGGAAINLLSVSTSESHSITGLTATATATLTAGVITGVTITEPGFGYSVSPSVTITDSTGVDGALETSSGFRLDTISVTSVGSGYTAAPSVTITNGLGDTFGSGGAATAVIGFAIASATILTPGRGYSIEPTVVLTGGSPITPAVLETTIGKKSGLVETVTITNAGSGYVSTPTLTFAGGEGSGATAAINIPSIGGNITQNGSGYVPGTYVSVPFTGAGAATPATATFVVPGLVGTLVGGSGYATNNFTNVPVRNNPTSTIAVTTSARTQLTFRYDDLDDYEWNIVDNGANTNYDFTRVSATGTASGSDISITAEVGDILTFNVNATGHPFWIQTVSGAYSSADVVTTGISNNGTESGQIVWNLSGVAPGTYYYVCANHQSMGGTITVSAYSGGTFTTGGGTITSSGGASGTATFVGSNFVRFASVSGGAFANGETLTQGSTTATVLGDPATYIVYLLGGIETPEQALLTHNSYTFDLSDSSNSGYPFTISGSGSFEYTTVGNAGDVGAKGYLVIRNTHPLSDVISYGNVGTTGNNFSISDGTSSQGVYGTGATVDIEINDSGVVSSWTFNAQGTGYKATDVLTVDTAEIGGGNGSGVEFTVTAYDTSISEVTNISSLGGPYAINDVLSVAPAFDGSGLGSGFQFTVTKIGYLDSVTINDAGFGYFVGKTLTILDPQGQLTTTGTAIDISVGTNTAIVPAELKYDGSLVSQNWSIDKDGNTNLGGGSITTTGPISSASLTASGNVSSSGTVSGSTLSVSTSANISNLTTAGTSNTLNSSSVKLLDGSAVAPSLAFQNSTTTGLYRESADSIGLSILGTQRGSISASGFDISTDFVVDQNLAELVPFLKVSATGETLTIGAAATQLQINNNASIEAVGTDTDVSITFTPKGTADVIVSGGVNKGFSVTDGSTEKFNIDSETGDTTVSGFLEVNGNLKLEDNIISNTGSIATTSFGQITTISATGTATGYTDNTYTAVTSTSSGSGTGATFDVTVASGDITAIAINSGGSGYAEGETITLDTATIGSGSGKTITVTDIEGAGIVIKPQTGKNVKVDSTAMFVVPSGNTNQRPPVGDRQTGGIRFNSQQQQFEGYNGTDFVSLGGVRDVNQDTYILTELSPGTNEDTFFFYNQGVNSLDITQDKFKLYTATTFDVSDVLVLNGIAAGTDALDVQFSGSSVLKVRQQKDVEITDGLRLKSVPVLGGVSAISPVTSTAAAYTPSGSFTGVASSAQFNGTGATFDVTIDGAGSVSSVTINAAGSLYESNEQITIAGNLLGGASPANDVTFTVQALSNPGTELSEIESLKSTLSITGTISTFNTELQDKNFLSLDGSGSEAAWRINRGWNGGTESYLTVFDSTATFMELDDCRLEGGQLSSFGASSTIVQFDKTSFKGAKTLVTIESDDNKVHMLEVTSVCAAGGTTAYFTVTNSIVSANDLVDAVVTVVGNNVQIGLSKSSAATSSTSFTGRFTTTKVKV